MNLHAFIFCWPRQSENAARIYDELRSRVDRVTVLDSSGGSAPGNERDRWIMTDSAFYYGHQFREALNLFDGDILLQIQADTAADWPALVDTCRTRYANTKNLGIWSPEIDFTAWPTSRVQIYDLPDSGLIGVAQTDCTVWSLSRKIADFLGTLDYSGNNFGWGIDWAAVSYAYANKLLVVRDSSVFVSHPKGSGYDHAAARTGMAGFLRQLPLDVIIQHRLLMSAIADRMGLTPAEMGLA